MVKFEFVTKTFGEFTALDNFSLEIPKGSAYGLLGSNGAGKSTLLRILSGVYRQDRGRVTIGGEPVYENVAVKQKIYYVSDSTKQYNNMTLSQMRDFSKSFHPAFSDEVFQKLHGVLKLPMDKKLSTFSKGMRRQAAVICAIASSPEYLLLDEAFDGLDPTMRIIVKKMLVDAMLDNNMTVIISSHNLSEIEEFCDTVGLLHKGGLVFNRELDDLKGNVVKIQTAFDKEVSAESFPALDVLHIQKTGSVVTLIARNDMDTAMNAVKAENPKFCDALPLTLEEVFVYEMEVLGYDHTGIDR